MRRLASLALVTAALLLPAGCGLFSGDEPAEEIVSDGPVRSNPVPVEAVGSVEIGRTRNGVVVSAFGIAPGTGFGAPQLRARRNGQPGPDGFLDLDFVAQPPDARLGMPQGEARARRIRADLPLPASRLEGVTGVRIHTLTSIVETPL